MLKKVRKGVETGVRGAGIRLDRLPWSRCRNGFYALSEANADDRPETRNPTIV